MFPSLLAIASSSHNVALHHTLDESCRHCVLPATIVAAKFNDDYYDDNNEPYQQGGDDRQRRQRPPAYMPREQTFATLGGLLKNHRQLGAGLLGLGMVLTFMGMMLFFEGTLLRLGNMCIIAGIPLLVGPDRVRSFFMKESRMQATIITAIGILLVFWGKPRLGILFEIFGLLNLFGNMFPLLFAVGRRLPVVGDILGMFESNGNGETKTRRPPRSDEYGAAGGMDDRPPTSKRYDPDF